MKRREFIALISGAAVAVPFAVPAQQTAVIGYVGTGSRESDAFRLPSFHQGLSESGYVEGRNVAIEYRWAEGQNDRLPQQRRSAMKVKDAMHKGADWVSPETPVIELAKLMREHDIGAIPIGENDRLVGMVTDRDIVCKGLAQESFDAGRATARDVMTPGIHCCREDDDLAKAVQHMEGLKVRRLPVINKNKRMVGMLSLGDISSSATGNLLTEWAKGVSAHH
jgi:CBS domain-containing protein